MLDYTLLLRPNFSAWRFVNSRHRAQTSSDLSVWSTYQAKWHPVFARCSFLGSAERCLFLYFTQCCKQVIKHHILYTTTCATSYQGRVRQKTWLNMTKALGEGLTVNLYVKKCPLMCGRCIIFYLLFFPSIPSDLMDDSMRYVPYIYLTTTYLTWSMGRIHFTLFLYERVCDHTFIEAALNYMKLDLIFCCVLVKF